MSVYSRWVDARGTTTIESTPALRQASKPVFSSRRGAQPCMAASIALFSSSTLKAPSIRAAMRP
jgi:hypothetical protein